MKSFLAFLHWVWGPLLVAACFPLSIAHFDPSSGGSGYGFAWQATIALAPLLVCLAKVYIQTNFSPGTFRMAGFTYLSAMVYSGWLGWTDLIGDIRIAGQADGFHLLILIGCAITFSVATALWVFKGTVKLRNAVMLRIVRTEWYQRIMDMHIDMNAEGLHGLQWLMDKGEAKKKYPAKFGLILGEPYQHNRLAIAAQLASEAAAAAKTFLTGGLVATGGGPKKAWNVIRYELNFGMTNLVGPPRTGKATTFGVNNLLNWQSGGSKGNVNIIAPFNVLDPKGELFAMTGIARARRGRRAIPLDPLNVLGNGFYADDDDVSRETGEYVRNHRWRCNPFDFISDRPLKFQASIEGLIEPLFPMAKGGGDDFWNNDGKKTLTGFWAWLADTSHWFDGSPIERDDIRRNPATASDFLAMSFDDLEKLRKVMASGIVYDENGTEIRIASIRDFPEVGMGIPKRMANELERTMKSEKQWSGLASTIQVQMRWCDQSMRECMTRSGCAHGTTVGSHDTSEFKEDAARFEPFNFKSLWDGKSDVYLIVPDTRMDILGPWLRMMVCGLANVLKENVHRMEGRYTVFLLDELATVGSMNEVLRMAGYAPGIGIHLVMIWQAIGQIKNEKSGYGPDGFTTIMASSYAKIFLGAADLDTAELITKTAGKTTAQAESTNMSGGTGQISANVSSSTQTASVDLVSLQKVLGTSRNHGWCVFSRETRTLLYEKQFYYLDSYFRENGRPVFPTPNPFDIAEQRKWMDRQRSKGIEPANRPGAAPEEAPPPNPGRLPKGLPVRPPAP
ncbi:hypothetical protein WV31_10330 [Magnetospirillum sp. ME-1]|uniref:type IV secretory system conjugative DNA transfer family protein n=1 Tax=Magnetospirillum sp. ME-1 TaxID=1639348 RepID=UPI000A17D813|nr:type IV secretory system conjugative DNA transfer family protein [Magnetospirillum sp. ME-1]ARJ66023.1 hypothetical protein WV31_10330 [Magnetospirillum sp. ME-1]